MDIRKAMEPPVEALPIAERGKDVDNTAEAIQAGRSDSSLNAEQNAAEIRTRASSPGSGLTDVSTPSSQSTTAQLENSTTTSGSSQGRRASSYTHRTPSPLNPSTSSASVSSSGGSAAPDEKKNNQSPTKPREGGAFSSRSSRPSSSLTLMQELLRQKSMPHLRPGKLGFLKDLEKRYSRYPTIGPDSRDQSSYNARPTRVPSTTHLLESATFSTSLAATNPFIETSLPGESEKCGHG